MTNDQITAIAREYAEADGYGLQIIQDDTEMFLRWLSRRFCLVEKSRIQEEYQKAQAQIKYGKELGIHGLVTCGGAKEILLESLFPEIGKEVEE